MKKMRNLVALLLFMFILAMSTTHGKAATTYYKGYSNTYDTLYKFAMVGTSKIHVYMDDEYQSTFYLKKVAKNLYMPTDAPDVRIKKSSNGIKIYSSSGRDGKVYIAGTYYRTSYRSTKLGGSYYGYGYYQNWNKIVLSSSKKYKVYSNGELYLSGKLTKVKTGVYKIPGSVVYIKLYGPCIKIYSSNGRDGKIPFGGVFYRR